MQDQHDALSVGTIGVIINMSLTQFQTRIQELSLLQNSWATQLNPILSNPTLKNLVLQSITLSSGDNVINHRLGRKLQGWMIADIDGAAAIFRNAPKNDLTLTLNSNAPVTVDILVY